MSTRTRKNARPPRSGSVPECPPPRRPPQSAVSRRPAAVTSAGARSGSGGGQGARRGEDRSAPTHRSDAVSHKRTYGYTAPLYTKSRGPTKQPTKLARVSYHLAELAQPHTNRNEKRNKRNTFPPTSQPMYGIINRAISPVVKKNIQTKLPCMYNNSSRGDHRN